jgi:hypothetical protein
MNGPENETVAHYVRDPQWIPHIYYPHSDSFEFCFAPRQARQAAVLLDPRFLSGRPKSPVIPAPAIEAVGGWDSASRIHFVFHTAFCGSTLLARALDFQGVSAGLAEPHVLHCLADHWAQNQRTPGAMAALGLAAALLARPLTPGETQVVKAHNAVNHIIPEVLCASPQSKALLLGADLEAFLRAILRRGQSGRLFARSLFHAFARVIPLPVSSDADGVLQSDLEAAAHAWLMQKAFMDAVARRFGPDRVRALSAEAFIDDPRASLIALAQFFEIRTPERHWERVAGGPIFGEHAKERGRPFNREAYLAQRMHLDAAHRDELSAAMSWGRALAARNNIGLRWEDNLLRTPVSN